MKECICGSPDTDRCFDETKQGEHQIRCISCGRSGRYEDTQKLAVKAWDEMILAFHIHAVGLKWLKSLEEKEVIDAKITFTGRIKKGSPEDKILDASEIADATEDKVRRALIKILEEKC